MSVTITGIERSASGTVAVRIATAVDLTDSGSGDGLADEESRRHLLPVEALILHRLHEGMTLPEADWERIRAEGALLLATRRGLEVLSRRQCTERELRSALADFEDGDVDRALERLHELGYIDDAAWAGRYVGSDRGRNRGRGLLRQELRARGIPEEVASGALEGRDDFRGALEAASKRARSFRTLEPERRERRVYDFLRRRGFADDIARRATREALAEVDAPA